MATDANLTVEGKGTYHFVARAADVIPGDDVRRANILIMTEEGPMICLYLPASVEAWLAKDAAKYLRGGG